MRSLARLATYLDEVGRDWIGWTIPPADRAWCDAGWVPDATDAYCPRCGGSVGLGEVTILGCPSCRDRALPYAATVRLGPYEESLREWILGVKYRGWSDMGNLLGRRLGLAIREAGVVDMQRAVVVPMPMPRLRRVHRGIDHARVIAGGVARELSAPVQSILTKQIGPTQVSVRPSDRVRNGGRGLRVRRRWGGWPVRDLHLVLVDDVRTSGASLRAAGRLLRKLQPGKLVVGVVAVSDEPSRRRRRERSDPSE